MHFWGLEDALKDSTAPRVGCEFALGYRAGCTEATVVGFGAGDDVLYVRFPDALEPGSCVGPIDAAQGLYDPGFNGRRVWVVVRVVGRAPFLGCDSNPTPKCPRQRGRLRRHRGGGRGLRRLGRRARLWSGCASRRWRGGDRRCLRRWRYDRSERWRRGHGRRRLGLGCRGRRRGRQSNLKSVRASFFLAC